MLDVFVSRPTSLAPEFTPGLENFLRLLNSHNLVPRTLGASDYPSRCPLDEVIRVLDDCSGAISLGYPQIVVSAGSVRGANIVPPLLLPTEWNHIEAGLAYARDLPLLVVHHDGIARGIFDRGTLDAFLHSVDLADSAWPLLPGITGALATWKSRVLEGKSRSRDNVDSEAEASHKRFALSENHVKALQALAVELDAQLETPTVAQQVGVSPQSTQFLLDQLREAGYIEEIYAVGQPPRYFLQPPGRAALYERGLL